MTILPDMVNIKATFLPAVKALEAQLRLVIWDQATTPADDREWVGLSIQCGVTFSKNLCQ